MYARPNLGIVSSIPVKFALISVLALAQTAGAEGGRVPLATVDIGLVSVRLTLNGHYENVLFTVSGPGDFYYREELEAGEQPVFDLPEAAEEGLYTYELRVGPPERIQSGSFSVEGSGFRVPETRGLEAKGNGVVDGSICIGDDCPIPVSNINFGDDTIRLMEEDLRIHFDDTTVAGGEPDNDWRLVVNDLDSAASSAEFFGIEDSGTGNIPFRVEAGARNNALYVESDGDVGVGTANPAKDLHIVTGATPTIRLEQDTSSANPSQVWDVKADDTGLTVFDDTDSKVRFFVGGDGKVGFGTNDPGALVHYHLGGTEFSANSSTAVVIQNNANATDGVILSLIGGSQDPGNGQVAFGDVEGEFQGRIVYTHGLDAMRFYTDSAERMRITDTGKIGIGVTSVDSSNVIKHSNGARLTTGGVWTDASSRALKQDVRDLSTESAMQALAALQPVTFRFKANTSEGHVGFIAEDVPDLVASIDRKGLAPMDVVAVLTKVVQEQQSVIEQHRAALEAQSSALSVLSAELAKLVRELQQPPD